MRPPAARRRRHDRARNAGPIEHFERWDIHKEGTQPAIRRVTEQAYWMPLHTYVNTYAFSKQLSFTPFRDELPRFYLASWK